MSIDDAARAIRARLLDAIERDTAPALTTSPGPFDAGALLNACEPPPSPTFADIERAIADLPPPSKHLVGLEVSPQMKAALDARLETRPAEGPYAPGLPIEVDPLLRFDPEVFRAVYADGHKEHRGPDDHPIWGRPKMSMGPAQPFLVSVRSMWTPRPSFYPQVFGMACPRPAPKQRRRKRASKGWRKHVRRMKAAARAGGTS